jgi:NADP-dependent 3-hydroxy acid dehydrogenase YdfG
VANGLLAQAVTLALAGEGADLILVGRNQERLDQLGKKVCLPVSRFLAHQVDLRNSDEVEISPGSSL